MLPRLMVHHERQMPKKCGGAGRQAGRVSSSLHCPVAASASCAAAAWHGACCTCTRGGLPSSTATSSLAISSSVGVLSAVPQPCSKQLRPVAGPAMSIDRRPRHAAFACLAPCCCWLCMLLPRLPHSWQMRCATLAAGHGGVVKIGDFGMSRYAESWRREEREGALERTLTPGSQGLPVVWMGEGVGGGGSPLLPCTQGSCGSAAQAMQGRACQLSLRLARAGCGHK